MTVGFIGLGDMGLPMARRLLTTGHELVVWNRTAAKIDSLLAIGATAAVSPAAVMAKADLVGLCLTSDHAVEEVAFGANGLFTIPAVAGKVVVDFSTGSPQAAISLAKRAAQLGAKWIDGPVSGGVPAAVTGKLIVFAGGESTALSAVEALLTSVAARVSHMGPSGCGQLAKICNQMIVACNLLMVGETMAMARKSGVDVTRLAAAFKGGFADSAPLQIFGPRMANHQFEPRLAAVALMTKDIGLAKAVATAVDAKVPILDLVRSLYALAQTSPDIDVNGDISQIVGLFESIQPKAIP